MNKKQPMGTGPTPFGGWTNSLSFPSIARLPLGSKPPFGGFRTQGEPSKGQQDDASWNEWLAGLTDGDGCFYINKKDKSISFEVTTHLTDARVLYELKKKLGAGTVTLRSNANAVRYRIKQKHVIIDIVHRINGKLYNPARLTQFITVCQMVNIPMKNSPPLLHPKNGYLAGIIDSDGTFTISSQSNATNSQISGVAGKIARLQDSRGTSQITCKVTSIYKNQVTLLKESFGIGTIREERPMKASKSNKTKFHWVVRSNDDFTILYEILKSFPLKSVKMHRLRLVPLYFKYKLLNHHLRAPGTLEFKVWEKFAKSWYKYSY
jgi:hypothetical protein